MLLRVFDVLVQWSSNIPVAGFVVIAALGWAIDAVEARTRGVRGRRTREILLS